MSFAVSVDWGRNFFAKKSHQTESGENWRAEGDYGVSSCRVWIHIFFAVVVHTSIYIDERDVVRETPLAEIVVYSRDELPSDSVTKLDYF